jgi:hypothetical protein
VTSESKHIVRVEIERWMIETGLVGDLRDGAHVNYVLECRLQPRWVGPVGASPPGLVHDGPITIVGQVGPLKIVDVESAVAVLNRADAANLEPGQNRQHWFTFSPYQERVRETLESHQVLSNRWIVAGLWEFDTRVGAAEMQRRRELPGEKELDALSGSLFTVDLRPDL